MGVKLQTTDRKVRTIYINIEATHLSSFHVVSRRNLHNHNLSLHRSSNLIRNLNIKSSTCIPFYFEHLTYMFIFARLCSHSLGVGRSCRLVLPNKIVRISNLFQTFHDIYPDHNCPLLPIQLEIHFSHPLGTDLDISKENNIRYKPQTRPIIFFFRLKPCVQLNL